MSRSPLQFFEDISAIPRPSGHMEAIAAFVTARAEDADCRWARDEAGNVTVYVPASAGYETCGTVMLQGHLDMVATKTARSTHDFVKDPIELIYDGDILTANETTLGADDGSAVAIMLAVLDDASLAHPALELVFTVDEEAGLLGADQMDCSGLAAKYMINIDSPKEGTLIVGCAAGKRWHMSVPYAPLKAAGTRLDIALEGLRGGHSGEDAHRGRPNANILLGRVLLALAEAFPARLAAFRGGSQDNAIAPSASASLFLPSDAGADARAFRSKAEELISEEEKKWKESEPGMLWSVELSEGETESAGREETLRMLGLLAELPCGVVKWSDEFPGLVHTSANVGVIRMKEGRFMASSHLRALTPEGMKLVSDMSEAAADKFGADKEMAAEYPGWVPSKNSAFLAKAVEVFTDMYGHAPKVEVIHAGLECGIISSKMPGIDAISMGPDLWDLHSPDERMSVSSFERVYDYTVKLLAAMDADSGL